MLQPKLLKNLLGPADSTSGQHHQTAWNSHRHTAVKQPAKDPESPNARQNEAIFLARYPVFNTSNMKACQFNVLPF